ncbi:MAG: amidase family protein, partial [Tumebacillaceae bacterium]
MENIQTLVTTDEWLVEATIEDLQEKMASGEVTSAQLVLLYFDRIARFDKNGPKLNSVLELNPDALFIAEALDLERQVKGPRGPLHGIPVLVKDNIDTGDKMHTSAGSLALANSYAAEDSFVAKQLRAAGAVILGKANMTEWANFMTVNMPNGFSSRGGQVLNPYGPGQFDVGGSSSGSGSSVAANLATVAVGSETSGSILSPAGRNSLVGIKPTVGLVSRTGIIPIAHSQDTAGPMARTVADAAILLGALTGVDERDPATLSSEGRYLSDYTTCLDANGLQGARIGIARDYYFAEELDEEQLALIEAAIEVLKQAGAEVIDSIAIENAKEIDDNYDVLVYEFKPALNAYLS